MRRSEVAEARWREFDLTAKLWSIPPERMKANAAHVVPLTALVVAVLERLPRFDSGDYLFTSTQGRKPITGFNRAKRALDAKMLAELGELPPFVLHDIRRSVRTGLSALPPSGAGSRSAGCLLCEEGRRRHADFRAIPQWRHFSGLAQEDNPDIR
jgi:integrase